MESFYVLSIMKPVKIDIKNKCSSYNFNKIDASLKSYNHNKKSYKNYI